MAATANDRTSSIQVSAQPGAGNSPVQAEKLKRLYLELLNLQLLTEKHPRATMPSTLNWGVCLAACSIDLSSDDTTIQPDWQMPGDPLQKLTDPARLVLATGAALTYGKQKKNNVAVVFCSQECLSRSKAILRFAAEHVLPIIFISLSMGNRSSDPNARLTNKRLPVLPIAIPVDASDAVAVYRVAHESIEKARRGAGPTLINCIGNRAENNGNARRRLENAISRMEGYLKKNGLWPPESSSSFPRLHEA